VFHARPGKVLEGKAAVTRELRIGFRQIRIAAALAVAPQQHWLLRARMLRQQTDQFEAGIAGCTEDRGLKRFFHFPYWCRRYAAPVNFRYFPGAYAPGSLLS